MANDKDFRVKNGLYVATNADILGNTVVGNRLSANGNVNFTNSPNVALGPVGNVVITGGTNGQFLQTNGSGGLAFATPSVSTIANGNSNVNIPAANGNVNISAAGNANIVVVSGLGANVNGFLTVTSTTSLGALTTGNAAQFASFTATGAVTGNANVSSLTAGMGFRGLFSTYTDNSAAASATIANAAIHGLAAPNLAAANTGVTFTNAATFYIAGAPVANTNATITNPYALYVAAGNSLFVANVSTGNVSGATGTFSTAANTPLVQNGTSNVAITSGANVTIGVAGTARITATSSGANVNGTLGVTGNANVGNIGATNANITAMTASGNVTAANFIGNLANGNSDVNIPAANGNINFDVAGNANVLVVTGTGAAVTGTLTATANITSQQIISNATTGVAPFIVSSTTTVANLAAATATSAATAGSASTAGTVTTAAQPNITSVTTSGGTFTVGNTSNGGVYFDRGQIVVNSNAGAAEGGQITLAWKTVTGATGQANSTWNMDSEASNNFRIFYQNATGVTGVALTAYSANGDILTGANLSTTSNLSVGSELSVTGNAVVTGNLSVQGNLIYINTETLAIEDPIINLQTGPNGAAPTSNSGKDVGTALNYYDTAARVAFMGWDVSNVEFGLASQASITNEVVTFTTYGNLRVGNIIGNGQALTGLPGANVTGTVPSATNATAVTANTSTATTVYLAGTSTAANGFSALEKVTGIYANMGNNAITATQFVGTHVGSVVANVANGTVIANNITASGAASGNINVATVIGNLGIRSIASTYTDNVSAAGTIANAAIHAIATPTVIASNAITTTNLATFFIQAAPTTSTNVTATNSYALYVGSGNSLFNGNVIANGLSITSGAAAKVTVTANAPPTADMVTITNAGQGTVTAGVSGMQLTFVGGAAAVEASAYRTDLTPGGTTGGTWNGFRMVAASGAASGVTMNAIKIDNITGGAGTENMIFAGTGWDNILNYNGTSVIYGNGKINGAEIVGTISATNAAAVQSNTSTNTTVYLAGTSTAGNANVALEKVTGIYANMGNNSITATTFVGSLSGAATSATNAAAVLTQTSTNTIVYLTGTQSSANGNVALEKVTGIFANMGNNSITATQFLGTHVGNVVANVANGVIFGNSHTASGAASGNANVSTVTGNLGIRALASTYTDNVAAAGAVANTAIHALGTPTLIASNAITTTNLSTFFIQSAPTAGTNVTATNSLALHVGSGNSLFNGNVTVGNLIGPHANGNSNVNIPVANSNVNISVAGNANILVVTGTGANIAGTANVTGNLTAGNVQTTGANGLVFANSHTASGAMSGNLNVSTVTGNLGFRALASTYTDNVAAAGTVANAAVHALGTPTLVASNAITTTNAATFFIQGAPTASTNVTITNGYALHVGAGNSLFAGTVTAGNLSTGGTLFVIANATFSNSVGVTGGVSAGGNVSGGNITTTGQLVSTVATGTAPLVVSSTTQVANLNAATAGTATSATNAAAVQSNTSTNNTVYLLGTATAANGNVSLEKVTGITANYAANTITATQFLGTHVGNVVANVANGVIFGNSHTASGAMSGNINVTTVTGNLGIRALASTYTDNVAAAGTVANAAIHALGTPTLVASNAITTTNAATFFIQGAPTASTNVTITNGYALHVGAGNSLFAATVTAGNLSTGGTLSVTGNANVGNIGAAAGVFTTVAGSLTTAAQGNITSVGTLTGLTANGNVTVNVAAGNRVSIAASAPPTVDILQITNTGQGVTTAGVNGINLTYVGGAAAIEASAYRTDFTPGGTTGGTWNGYRMVASAGAASGVTMNAFKVDNITGGAGTENMFYAGTGWDNILNYNGTSVIFGNGTVNASQVTGTVSSATTAGTVTTNAQPNITSVGTLTSLTVSGNATVGNLLGPHANGNSNVNIPAANGNINLTAVGNVTLVVTGTGANITGTLNATGNANVGNLGTAFVGASANVTAPTLISNVATGTAPLTVTSTTRVANLNVAYANVSDFDVVTAATTGTFYPQFINGATSGNYAAQTNAAFTFNAATGAFNASLLGGTLTTAAQPNVTSVGTLTSLSVTGNVTVGNLIGIFANGNSSIAIPAANGNINLNAAGAATPELIVTSAGANINGTLTVSTSATIGTATDGIKVDVTGTNQTFIRTVGTASSVDVRLGVNGSNGQFGTTSNHILNISTNATTRMSIDTSGIVSVTNTTAASSRTTGALVVAGGIGANANSFFTNLNITSNVAYVSPNGANTINSQMLNGGTLAWSGNAGQLFSITDSMTGNIFTVNDVSGIPMISVDAGGNIQFAVSGGFVNYGVTTGITAAGSTQGTAKALTRPIGVVSTVANGANGIILPTVPAGARIIIVNTSANALNVYPPSGAVVNAGATNAAYSQPAGARLEYFSVSTTQWYTLNATYG